MGAFGNATNLTVNVPRSTIAESAGSRSSVLKSKVHCPIPSMFFQYDRIASIPTTGAEFGGINQASGAKTEATESDSSVTYHPSILTFRASITRRAAATSSRLSARQPDSTAKASTIRTNRMVDPPGGVNAFAHREVDES